MGFTKHHHTKHRSDHRDPKKKLKRVLKIGSIHFFVPTGLLLIISLTHQQLLATCNIWLLRSFTLLVVFWWLVGFFVLAGGITLWLRVKAG